MWLIVIFLIIASAIIFVDYFSEENESHEVEFKKTNKQNKVNIPKAYFWGVSVIAILSIVTLGLFTINVAPFNAFGGAVWVKDGVHYISDEEISIRISDINEPVEKSMKERIIEATPTCNVAEWGFCQKSPGIFAYKITVKSAVEYQPGTPDRKEITGYCTLCRDGTFSPSCAVGRGACSWHGGVASYNVARYRTIPGTPEVQAKEAIYSYEQKTYKDSNLYKKPSDPSLKEIVSY